MAINLKNLLYSLSLTILSRTAFGGRFKQQDAFKKLLPDIVELFGGISVFDVYPSIKFLHLINAVRPKQRRLHREADLILESALQEHKAAMKQENEDLFLAGAEPTASIVEWAMSELLINPQVMQKAQAEVRRVIGGGEDVNESAIVGLKYLNVVIKETLRLHPPAPLLLPRECQESCEVMGYKYEPERFTESPLSYKGTDFELIPFGAGKRMCPGMSYGIANVELIQLYLQIYFIILIGSFLMEWNLEILTWLRFSVLH
ncbi:putative Retrotransposon protein, unclassified, expressed [Hibiscus syriacus]|uniref:Retrotransposon protein, unclassified, expressed n=1 Tax=Hibiscus syriacus TaxID=106335 RepID=A0A6A2ZRJ8_HIBSY|nr:putative Retrotransposon protein, unclassified, expressed [Hibiscus syriacus]